MSEDQNYLGCIKRAKEWCPPRKVPSYPQCREIITRSRVTDHFLKSSRGSLRTWNLQQKSKPPQNKVLEQNST